MTTDFEQYLSKRGGKRRRTAAVIFNGTEVSHLAERFSISDSEARKILRSEGWELGISGSGSRQVWYPPGSSLPYSPVR